MAGSFVNIEITKNDMTLIVKPEARIDISVPEMADVTVVSNQVIEF